MNPKLIQMMLFVICAAMVLTDLIYLNPALRIPTLLLWIGLSVAVIGYAQYNRPKHSADTTGIDKADSIAFERGAQTPSVKHYTSILELDREYAKGTMTEQDYSQHHARLMKYENR